ncbi:MAG: hypothetical protein J7464_15510, partial [Chloroflexus sp.]|nr:hypothetical protein [Chloroflexus sp.]
LQLPRSDTDYGTERGFLCSKSLNTITAEAGSKLPADYQGLSVFFSFKLYVMTANGSTKERYRRTSRSH